MKAVLTAERARELLSYDRDTGDLRWRVSRGGNLKGSLAGNIFVESTGKTYWQVRIETRFYYAHRIIWLMETGAFPERGVDHKDGNGINNRWINLREADQFLNQQNQRRPPKHNTSGFLGVSKKGKRFSAGIRIPNGGRKHLGTFDTAEAAHAAYVIEKRVLHPGCTI